MPRWLGLEEQGVATGKFFVEPVILTVNYAMEVLGYKHIVMMGLSGGGWTTTLAVRNCNSYSRLAELRSGFVHLLLL